MRRRELLTAGALVALAGCSGSDPNGDTADDPKNESEPTNETNDTSESTDTNDTDPEPESEPEPNLSITDTTLTTDQVKTGEPVSVTVTVANDGDAAGDLELDLLANGTALEDEPLVVDVDANATETVTLEWVFDEPQETNLTINDVDVGTVTVELPDEKRAAQLLADAQATLETAVDRVADPKPSITTSPAGDDALAADLDTMQSTLDEVMDLQLTGTQMQTVEAFEATAPALRAVVDAHSAAMALEDDVDDAIEMFEDGGVPDEPTDNLETAREAITDARDKIDAAVDDVDLELVDALGRDELDGWIDGLEDDVETVPTLVDGCSAIDSAENDFWGSYWAFHERGSEDRLDYGRDGFQTGLSALGAIASIGFEADVEASLAYTRAMEKAALHYGRASIARSRGEDPSDDVEKAETALDEAEAAGLDDRFNSEERDQSGP